MGTTIEVTFGATKRGQSRHLLVDGSSLCGQVDADQLTAPGAMTLEGSTAYVLTAGRVWAVGGRIASLPVCTRCALHAAALHAAASDG